MARAIQIRMGGYGPATTGFSKSLKFIGERLEKQFGDRIAVKYVWNIMDFGYRAEEILWLVESGVLTLGYQSSSYLTDRVPELGFVDLPFLFARNDQARAAMDGKLGNFLAQKIEERVDYRILGWFENGFRQISNRLRTIRSPADMKDMRIRVLPSEVQARASALRSHRGDRRHQGRHHRRAREPVREYGHVSRAQISSLSFGDEPLLCLAPDLPASAVVRRVAAGLAGRNARSGHGLDRVPARPRRGRGC